MLTELRCTGCNAPLDASPSRGGVVRCRYCGASFLAQEPVAGETKETYAVSLDAVGPSNRARIARLLVHHAGLDLQAAEALLARAPCDVVVWDDASRAHGLHRELVAGGASADVITRIVAVPAPAVLPAVSVLLEEVGANKVSVIKVVREHTGIGMAEAKALVESAPCVVVATIEGGRGNALRDALNGAGATARTR